MRKGQDPSNYRRAAEQSPQPRQTLSLHFTRLSVFSFFFFLLFSSPFLRFVRSFLLFFFPSRSHRVFVFRYWFRSTVATTWLTSSFRCSLLFFLNVIINRALSRVLPTTRGTKRKKMNRKKERHKEVKEKGRRPD